MDDSHDDSRWLTYDEIATFKRIKRSGAIRWVQRHRWRRQTGKRWTGARFSPVRAGRPEGCAARAILAHRS
jgi:hypothetical protein